MNREHAIEVANDTLMKRYKGIRKVLLRADAKAVVNRLVHLEDARIAELTAEVEKLSLQLKWSRNTINALANTTRDESTREQARKALKEEV